MNTHTSSRRRILVVGALLAGAVVFAVNAFAIISATPATATVCIKPNGQLRVVTPKNPACVEPERSLSKTARASSRAG